MYGVAIMMLSTEAATKAIGTIIVPAVLISACAILLNGLILRYKAIEDLLRSLNHEWLNLKEIDAGNGNISIDRVYHLEHLISKLFVHHHILHDVLIYIYLSILIFVVDMLAIAVAGATSIQWVSYLVLFIFLLGVGILCWSLFLTCYEMRAAHEFIQIELQKSCHSCNSRRGKSRASLFNYSSTFHH
ncbi:hypothetical protein NIES4071_09500 [Calothrix sp. NIES-4071]|nr:hypothetical protein NIES4071_09500 [Calothrix sp. NIES-4071]BAZ55292.1 hypothetical protein NIES4105_09460 [Calothrix sp. NIES-4105]